MKRLRFMKGFRASIEVRVHVRLWFMKGCRVYWSGFIA